MGVLKKRTPPGGALELENGSTIRDALAALDLPNKRINAVSLNGGVERDFSRPLKAGDELVVLPPVGGGSRLPSSSGLRALGGHDGLIGRG